jgi:membrane-associated protein
MIELFQTFAMFGINPEAIAEAGLWLIALIIFAESGLLIGFFLPGDTLLIAAGVMAATGSLSLGGVIAAIAIAAIVGDNVGYTIGRYSGKRLFHKKDGVLFRQEYVERAEAFYEKHGGKTIILARFIPIVRTFAPVVAGIGKMSRGKFFAYNVVGGILWATTLPLLGYYVGSKIPQIGDYLEYAIVFVVFASIAPAVWHIVSSQKSRSMIARGVKKFLRRRHQEHAKEDNESEQ